MSEDTSWGTPDHHIEEGGWQKPVAPPVATAVPPPGLPPTSAGPTPAPPATAKEK